MTLRDKLIEAMSRDISATLSLDPENWELFAGTMELTLTLLSQSYYVVPKTCPHTPHIVEGDIAQVWDMILPRVDIARPSETAKEAE